MTTNAGNSSLQLGIAAFKAGDKIQARSYLLGAVREDPNNEQAWGWLSNIADNVEERVRYLREVLRINPQNASAKKFLEELEHNPTVENWASAAPAGTTQVPSDQSNQPLTPNSLKQVINSDPLYRRNSMYAIASSISSIGSILLILGLLIICCVVVFAIYGSGSH